MQLSLDVLASMSSLDLLSMPVVPLLDTCLLRTPRAVHEEAAWWPAWAWKAFDPFELTQHALKELKSLMPEVGSPFHTLY